MPGHPTDSIWPASPPREVPYCVAATLDHKLVSPAAVEDWTGSPPMWFACGREKRGVDGNRVVASQAAKSGVTVIWNDIFFNSGLQPAKPLRGGKIGARELQSGAVRCLMPDCKPMVLGSPVGIAPLPFEEVRKRMEYNATRPVWTGKLHEHKL
ncbi:hypothetical protein AFCA_009329 [Aspergillus flavus]|nr:hypothetical protein AFCA_009329 [Aspergillus flavus]